MLTQQEKNAGIGIDVVDTDANKVDKTQRMQMEQTI